MKKITLQFIKILLVIVILPAQVLAISQEQKNIYSSGVPYFDHDDTRCITGAGANPVGGAPTQNLQEFVDKYGQFAYEESLTSGIPYDFTLAQAMVESGYGESRLTTEANNFFGIKAGSSWTGATITMSTREEGPNGSYYVDAVFRAYASPTEGFIDHSRLFIENSRYAEALKYPNDPYKFLEEIWKAGYATDSNYVTIVGGVLDSTQEYIAENKDWPPSSEITYNIDPTTGNPAISIGGGTSGTGCSSSSSASGSLANVIEIAEQELAKNPVEYDENVDKYTTGIDEAWCADFVSWVFKQAGIPFSGGASGGWRYPAVLGLQAMFRNTAGYEFFDVGTKPPMPGDVAFYIGAQTPDGGSTRHTNIVISVQGGTMTTIGGNEGDKVTKSTKDIQLGSESLVGFGRKL